jgi:hypothetical protein
VLGQSFTLETQGETGRAPTEKKGQQVSSGLNTLASRQRKMLRRADARFPRPPRLNLKCALSAGPWQPLGGGPQTA